VVIIVVVVAIIIIIMIIIKCHTSFCTEKPSAESPGQICPGRKKRWLFSLSHP